MDKRRVRNHNDRYVVFYEFDDGTFEDVPEPVAEADDGTVAKADDGTEPTAETEDD